MKVSSIARDIFVSSRLTRLSWAVLQCILLIKLYLKLSFLGIPSTISTTLKTGEVLLKRC